MAKVKIKMLAGRAGAREVFKAGGIYLVDAERAQKWAERGICKMLEPATAPAPPERKERVAPPAAQERKRRNTKK